MAARQSSAPKPESASSDVGYGRPPRHTQFRKGQSGNPGGRPRRVREPAERLKELTLREAYRTVIVRKRPDGVGDPALAIQEVLRSQVELAMNGNVRAQRDILNAVRAYERDDKQAETLEIYTEWLMQQGLDLETAIHEAKTLDQKIDFVAAARKVAELLRLEWPPRRQTAESGTAESETGSPATEVDAANGGGAQAGRVQAGRTETHTESAHEDDADEARPAAARTPPLADAEERDTEREAPAPARDQAPSAPRAASPPPAADPRPSRSRHARRRVRESMPSASADCSLAGHLHSPIVHRGTGASVLPFNVTWKDLASRHGQRQELKNSLLNSLFSGNDGWLEDAPAAPEPGRRRRPHGRGGTSARSKCQTHRPPSTAVRALPSGRPVC